jgi:hypothetical protein
MRKINSIIAIIAVSIAASSSAYAQESAQAATSGNVIEPIAITSDVPMSFGNFAKNGAGGNLVLSANGVRTSDNVTLVTSGSDNDPTAAQFNVTGEDDYTFTVTLPIDGFVLTNADGAAETMTVNTFTSTLVAEQGTLTSGAATFGVGATLVVAADQVVGNYVNETGFTVSVNYN